MAQTRIIDQETDLQLETGDYILVDSLDEGTRKFDLGGHIESTEEAISELSNKIGDSTMGTTATTITGAIAEHEGDISLLNSSLTPVSSGFLTPISSTINSSTTALIFYKIGRIGILYYNIGWISVSSGIEVDVCNISQYGTPIVKYNFTTTGQSGKPFLFQLYETGRLSAIGVSHSDPAMTRGTLVFPLN